MLLTNLTSGKTSLEEPKSETLRVASWYRHMYTVGGCQLLDLSSVMESVRPTPPSTYLYRVLSIDVSGANMEIVCNLDVVADAPLEYWIDLPQISSQELRMDAKPAVTCVY